MILSLCVTLVASEKSWLQSKITLSLIFVKTSCVVQEEFTFLVVTSSWPTKDEFAVHVHGRPIALKSTFTMLPDRVDPLQLLSNISSSRSN